ncbi:MAG: DnaJ domain-containing protein [Oligoflexia bacterium]|nr:DnaJ domain-containing protein [Oligoflexia bacterium]
MINHYATLGLHTSATPEEIRRAYRILARRYHPDVNPGKASEEKFKSIAQAYDVLSDEKRKQAYDLELEQALRDKAAMGFKAYQQATKAHVSARKRFYEAKHENFGKLQPEGPEIAPDPTPPPPSQPGLADLWYKAKKAFLGPPARRARPTPGPKRASPRPESAGRPGFQTRPAEPVPERPISQDLHQPSVVRISVVEVSVSLRDAVYGVRKTVEVSEPEGSRKISVNVPPGVRSGSVVHLRSKGTHSEDLVVVIRVATHPFLSMAPRGLICEIPITVGEALSASSISIPTLEDPVVVKIPPGCQSGTELRLRGKGAPQKDGTRGDLFIRFMVMLPESPEAVGLKDKAQALEAYYEKQVRQALPKTLLDE